MIPRSLCQVLSRSFTRTSTLSSSLLNSTMPFHCCSSWYSSTPFSKVERPRSCQETVLDADEEKKLTLDIISEVNNQITRNEQGRLFAIVHISGRQTKVTPDDIIIVDNNSFSPLNGDKIKFEKVLLVGGADFTLVGRPLLSPGLVNVTGTIIEKDLSHTRTNFRKIPRKRHMRLRFFRTQLTMIRINEVEIVDKLGHREDVEGTDRLIK